MVKVEFAEDLTVSELSDKNLLRLELGHSVCGALICLGSEDKG